MATPEDAWLTASFRAHAAQQRIVDLDAQLRVAHHHRDRAIREAVDGGAPLRDLTKVLGLGRASIYRILGTAG